LVAARRVPQNPRMDALSELLQVVRLSGAIFLHARFTAPWSYPSPRADRVLPLLEPGAERMVIFHLVSDGACTVELPGEPAVRLEAGDVVLLPQGDAHRLCSRPGVAPARIPRLEVLLAQLPAELQHGGGGEPCRLVCGYMACDDRVAHMLFDGLPRVLRVRLRGSGAGAWLEASVRYALTEVGATRPGGSSVLARLAEVLFIEILRCHMNEQGANARGWLAASRDRVVGAALAAMHARPAEDWTLEALAGAASTSRSVLAERFQQMLGVAPMQYLTQWRLQLAAQRLRTSNASLIEVANEVGYQTDTALSRAFRREYGLPPATWRRRLAGGGGPARPA